jgi:hypothetical protein
VSAKHHRLNIYFERETLRALDAHAARRGLSKSAVVEAAVAAFLSPETSTEPNVALGRRLDRLNRQLERLARDQMISAEALALFVRFWLTATPPLPETLQAAALAKGKERYADFVETLGRRLAQGATLARDVRADEIAPGNGEEQR